MRRVVAVAPPRTRAPRGAALCLLLAACAAFVPTMPAFAAAPQEARMMHATGTFEVKVVPQSPDSEPAKAAGAMRLSLAKTYHGALEASGHGEMLANNAGTEGNGAYVAMEKVDGTLDGRKGSFFLVHRALMRGGTPAEWTVAVVPGSGTDALAGLEGGMRIRIANKQHYYDFEYTLPER